MRENTNKNTTNKNFPKTNKSVYPFSINIAYIQRLFTICTLWLNTQMVSTDDSEIILENLNYAALPYFTVYTLV